MNRDSVTYRLGTSGERDVENTLARIAEAGDASARRLGQSYDRDLRLAEAAFGRLERSAERLKTLGGSDIQRVIAGNTGIGASEAGRIKDAEASMRVFIQRQDELASARARLLSQFDPLFAAQQRYDATLAEANSLQRQGAITAEEMANVQARAVLQLAGTRAEQERITRTSGAMTAGFQQAGFQVSDFFVQVGAGTPAMRAAAQQAPQLIQSIALMGAGAEGSKGKFASFMGFLAGPWGAALTVGVSLIGIFASKMGEADKASDDLKGALDFQRMSTEQLNKAIREKNAEQEKAIRNSYAAAEAARAEAEQNLRTAITERERVRALVERNMEAAKLERGAGMYGAGTGSVSAAVAGSQNNLAEQDRNIAALRESLRLAEIPITRREVEAGNDPVARAALARERAEARLDEQYRRGEITKERHRQLLDQEADAYKRASDAAQAARQKVTGISSSQGSNLGDMVALVERLFPGAHISSTFRKGDKGDHGVGRAIDFIPAGGMSQFTTAQVEQMLRDAGVEIRRGSRGNMQMFGPGRSASRPGDHDDHFHFAWSGRSSPEEAEKRLADERERNVEAVRALIDAGDPFVAVSNKLKDDLAEIDRLAKVSPAQGGIGSEQAEILRSQARANAGTRRDSLFAETFKDVSDYGKKMAEEAERRSETIARITFDQTRENELLDLGVKLARAGADEREREEERLRFTHYLLEQGLPLEDARVQALIRGNDVLVERAQAERRAAQAIEEQRRIGEQLIDTLFDPSNWDDWGEMGKRIIQMLVQEMLVLGAVNPLKNAIFGLALPTLTGVLSGGGPADLLAGTPYGNAIGTEWSSGGWRRVGEFGEELVRLPRGAQVMNAGRTRQADRQAPAQQPMQVTINADGADPAQLRQVVAALDRLNTSLESRAVGAVMKAHADTFGQIWN